MKLITSLCLPFVLAIFLSCQSPTKKDTTRSGDSTGTTRQDSAATANPDPDPTDTIPAGGYDPATANIQTAAMIKQSLTATILANDLQAIPADQRKFKYQAFDLNNDSLPEYFVAMTGTYFCGTGGCTAYLLDNKGNLVNSFTVVSFPIYVASGTTAGWQDLVMESKGKFHLIKIKDGKYPSNPSVAPLFKGDPKNKGTEVLNVAEGPYPAFSF